MIEPPPPLPPPSEASGSDSLWLGEGRVRVGGKAGATDEN